MVSEFESVSVAMSDPDADFDALTRKMTQLQVRGVNSTRSYTAKDQYVHAVLPEQV